MFDFIKAWGDRLQEAIDKLRGKRRPPQPPPPQRIEDHVVTRITTWYGGEDMHRATIDPDYRLTVTPDGLDWSSPPMHWNEAGRMLFPAICAAAYQLPNGTWVGGKYEWLPRPPRRRGWGNIHNRYGGWVAPRSGTRMLVWAYNSNIGRVSNTVEVTFK